MTDLTPAEGLAAHTLNTLEPALYDQLGQALYCVDLAHAMQNKAGRDAARIVAQRVDNGQE